MRLIALGSVATAIVTWLVFAVYSIRELDITWPTRLLILAVLLVVFGGTEWLLWSALKPPVLRADTMQVTCAAMFDRQRMQRSDLAFIFRGQAKPRAQPRGPWIKSYIFAASDGKVGISCSPQIFTPDGMAQFAQRLQVPIKGDFRLQVRDRVDPTTT